MFNKAKFVFVATLFFMHSFMMVTSMQASDLSPMIFNSSSESLWEDSSVAGTKCIDSPVASTKVIDLLEACATTEYIEVPGKPHHHAFVFVRNLNFKHGEAPAAVGILSSPDPDSLALCKVALKRTLEAARSSNLTMKIGFDSNPFFVHRRSIMYGPDVIKDFDLIVDAPSELSSEVTYSLAFPQGPDMCCHPIVIMPHAHKYIADLAHDSDAYKDEGAQFLDRIKKHAHVLSQSKPIPNWPICTIPLLIVDLQKLATIVAVEDSLYSRHA